MRAQLADSFDLLISGDYGGFDIGSSSHRTWSLLGLLLYELGEHWDLSVGWRHLVVERDQTELRIDGPLLGAIYRF